MERGMEKNLGKPKEKPRSSGGAKGFTRAMLLTTLAAINAPADAKAQDPMHSGVTRTMQGVDTIEHHKKEEKHAPTRIENVKSRQEILEQYRHDSTLFFREHPQVFDSIPAPDLRVILDSMETINERSVQGTRYEFQGVPTGEMVLNGKKGEHGNGIALRFYEENPDAPGLKERYVVVTARHVAEMVATPNGKAWTHHPRNVDLSTVELTKEESIMYLPLFLGRKNMDADLSGEVVSILGIDTDKEKHIPAVLSPRMTSHLHNIAQMDTPINWQNEDDWAQLTEPRFVLLPREETQHDLSFDTNKNGILDGDEKHYIAIQGMSGSPIVYLPPGGKGVEICAIIMAAGEIDVEGKRYSVGYVADQKHIWETIKALPGIGQQKNAERPQTGASDGWITRVEDQR